jgi:nucleoid-associated protein YgaU
MGTVLKIPYASQKDTKTAGYSFNDCGPACVNMMVLATGQNVTTDQIYRRAGIVDKGALSVRTVMNAGNLYGLNLGYHDISSDSSISSLRTWIDQGRPALALIDYAPIMRARYHESSIIGGHFALVVGYDDDDVIVHDPYWNGKGGAYRYWKIPVFLESWYARGTQYQRVALVPKASIAQPDKPAYDVPDDIWRRMRAKAQFEGTVTPKINNQEDYNTALTWLGDWGLQTKTYTVAQGDTLGLIAIKYYGGPQFYTSIAIYNNISDPGNIKVGQQILIPLPDPKSTQGTTDAPTADLAPKDTYTNQEVINAFHDAFAERGLPDQYWNCIVSCGISSIADNRTAVYTGPDIMSMTALTAEMKALVYKHLTN